MFLETFNRKVFPESFSGKFFSGKFFQKFFLKDFFKTIESKHIGKPFLHSKQIDNTELIKVNEIIRSHPVELIGKKLRTSMTSMKTIV